MKDTIFPILALLTALTKLIPPGGSRALIAEKLSLKQQLITRERVIQAFSRLEEPVGITA